VRNTSTKTRKQVFHKLKKTAEALSILHDARIKVSILEGCPPVINHPEGYRIARETAEEMIGKNKVINLVKPSMGGEDFSYYLQEIPGCFVRFGSREKGREYSTAHSSTFDFNEDVIKTGAEFFAHIAHNALASLRKKLRDD
jgi:metal-dependent amidase/aminoacylase/carboxypeptidase family protein